MVKILSSSGRSISDLYDVEGSIVGIQQLLVSDGISLVHEMGATTFSERASGAIKRLATADILQSVTFDVVLTDLPAGVFRVLGVSVIASVASRTNRCMVALRDRDDGREIPIFVWDATEDVETEIRIDTNGAGPVSKSALTTRAVQTPSVGFGGGQPQRVGDLAMRGISSGFGAGNVTLEALVYLGFSQVGGLSSRGLPVPSW